MSEKTQQDQKISCLNVKEKSRLTIWQNGDDAMAEN